MGTKKDVILQSGGQHGGMGNLNTMPLPSLIFIIGKPGKNMDILPSGKPLGIPFILLTVLKEPLSSQPLDV